MQYANHFGWTDVKPFEIVGKTAKTLTLRAMDCERDPNYKPECVIGGFSATCVNQNEQKWIITSNPDNPKIKAYLRKDGNYYSRYGKHVISDTPMKFYDYNF